MVLAPIPFRPWVGVGLWSLLVRWGAQADGGSVSMCFCDFQGRKEEKVKWLLKASPRKDTYHAAHISQAQTSYKAYLTSGWGPGKYNSVMCLPGKRRSEYLWIALRLPPWQYPGLRKWLLAITELLKTMANRLCVFETSPAPHCQAVNRRLPP